jgi:hypothetical protein
MAPYPEWILEESLAGTGWRRLSEQGWERLAPDEPVEASACGEPALHAPRRWGLSAEAVAHLGERLSQCWRRFRGCFTTRTRDTRTHASDYLRAQLPSAESSDLFGHGQMRFLLTTIIGIDTHCEFVSAQQAVRL